MFLEFHGSRSWAGRTGQILASRTCLLQQDFRGGRVLGPYAVKASDVATFPGRKLHANYQGEIGNDYHTRIQGTRIKHSMGRQSITLLVRMSQALSCPHRGQRKPSGRCARISASIAL